MKPSSSRANRIGARERAVEVDQAAEESPPANVEDEAEFTEPVNTQIQ